MSMVIPRRGDIWEFKLPDKPKRQKQIGKIWRKKGEGNWNADWSVWTGRTYMYIDWYRMPKGRYTGIKVKTLLKYGHRISTLAEREAEQEKRWREMELRRPIPKRKKSGDS